MLQEAKRIKRAKARVLFFIWCCVFKVVGLWTFWEMPSDASWKWEVGSRKWEVGSGKWEVGKMGARRSS